MYRQRVVSFLYKCQAMPARGVPGSENAASTDVPGESSSERHVGQADRIDRPDVTEAIPRVQGIGSHFTTTRDFALRYINHISRSLSKRL